MQKCGNAREQHPGSNSNMVRSVMIARVADGYPLCATMDDETLESDFPEYKAQFKAIIKPLREQAEPMCSVEARNGAFFFYILLANGIGFICLCEKSYPRKLAFSFLNDLHQNFIGEIPLERVEAAPKPYAFISFESTIKRLCKSYQDTRAKQNINRLQEELVDVSNIMTSNIQQVLERGNKLDKMRLISEGLSADSKRYMQDTRYLNLQAMYQKYGPLVFIVSLFLLILYVYWKFF